MCLIKKLCLKPKIKLILRTMWEISMVCKCVRGGGGTKKGDNFHIFIVSVFFSLALCVIGGTYSKAYEFFYVDMMQRRSLVHVMLKVSESQNQFLFHQDWSHVMMVHDFELYAQHGPICHLEFTRIYLC